LIAKVIPAESSGELAFVQVKRNGVGGVVGLFAPHGLAVSRDGASLYAAGDAGVVVFRRDLNAGTLSFLETFPGPPDGGLLARALTVSNDGRHVYVVGDWITYTEDGIPVVEGSVLAFRRDTATGSLALQERHGGVAGGGLGLKGVRSVVVSPNGDHLYTAAFSDSAVTLFRRDQVTGSLAFVAAYRDGMDGVDGIGAAAAVAVNPDGRQVYAVGWEDAFAVFNRDIVTGGLEFVDVHRDGIGGANGLAGASAAAVSADGSTVYIAGQHDHALAGFHRNAADGSVTFLDVLEDGVDGVEGLEAAVSVVVSPDDSHVYAAGISANAVALFQRDATTGLLESVEAYRIRGLGASTAVALSPDGAHLYVASLNGPIGVFARARSTCPSLPRSDCGLPTEPGAAAVVLRDTREEKQGVLIWEWRGQSETATQDFRELIDPQVSYAVCVYSGTAQPSLLLSLPSRHECRRRNGCWNVKRDRVKYAWQADHSQSRITLKRNRHGSSEIDMRWVGSDFRLPAQPLETPVSVQFTVAGGPCWGARYSTPSKNLAGHFKARSD
jgi:6-phosphogluconolactonase (cycloisomerase 2 family)